MSTVFSMSSPKSALTLLLLCECVAAFKRPRFKRVGMKRAKKTKPVIAEAENLMQERIAVAGPGGGQAADPAALQQHSGVAAAPAPADKLQQQLEAAQFEQYRANVYDDMCRKELVKAEKHNTISI